MELKDTQMPLTYSQMREREEQVLGLIDEGLNSAQIADRVGVRPQSMARFLKTRNWKTKTNFSGKSIAAEEEKKRTAEERKAKLAAIDTTPPKRK